jgi:hypothetical protein
MKKLIITESQYTKLLENILLETDYDHVVETIVKDLNNNYEKSTAVVAGFRDYHEEPMFKVKVSDSLISAKDLLEYFEDKYSELCSKEFLKQVIEDWTFGRIKGGMLSKNIPIR